MGDIVIKTSEARSNPKDPKTYPGFESGVAKAKRLGLYERHTKNMTTGERHDYDKAVASNPSNIPGLPPFFPPLKLRASGIGDGEPTEMLPCGHQWRVTKVTLDGAVSRRCKYGHEFTQGKITRPGGSS